MLPRNSGRECAELRQTSAMTTRGARSGDSGLQRSSGKYPSLRPGRRTNSRADSSEIARCMAGWKLADDLMDKKAKRMFTEGPAVVLCRHRWRCGHTAEELVDLKGRSGLM